MNSLLHPDNWYEVYTLYQTHIFTTYPVQQATIAWNAFKTAVLRYLIMEFGFQRSNPTAKMTKAETKAAEEFLHSLPMRSLLRVRPAMVEALTKLQASSSSCNSYTSRINQFLTWGEQQAWWPNNRGANGKFRSQCCPPSSTKGRRKPPKLIAGKSMMTSYGLKIHELPQELRQHLNHFHCFLTEPNHLERTFTRIEESTAKGYRKETLLILGWFHNLNAPVVPIHQLSLNLIFPVFDEAFLESMDTRELQKFWRREKKQFKKWLYDYRSFLQNIQHAYSPYSWRMKLETILAVGRYQWADRIEYKADYQQIPLFPELSEEFRKIQAEIQIWEENHQTVADWTQKWPNVPEGKSALDVIREEVLEQLRLRCLPRTAIRAKVRKSTTLAVCHQRFLMWALHSLIPPHRQQVARTEQIATSCPRKRPDDVPLDGLYHPLPPDLLLEKRKTNNTVKENFLCRLYSYKGKTYPNGAWIRVIRDYKTWKTHGDQEFILPDWKFADGTTLYCYIEQYLYGYWLPGAFKGAHPYTWCDPSLDGQMGKWISSGRAQFNPIDRCSIDVSTPTFTWGYLFVMPKKGLPFNYGDFSDAFAQGSLTTIEKWITPHVLRSVWATWGYETHLSDIELRSLAYSMGMTIETLRQVYEKCTPAQKRQPIEQAIQDRLFKDPDVPVISVEKMIRLAKALNIGDRQRLVAALLEGKSND